VTKQLSGKASNSEVGDVVFAPVTPPTFVEIMFTNAAETCPATIKGPKNVTGEQLCSLFSPTEDLKLHTLGCEPVGSKLKLSEHLAEFQLSLDVELDNDTTDFWSLDRG
jgi:hypothetical protein